MKSFTRSTIASLCLLAPLICRGEPITWTGTVNLTWDTATLNWKKNADNTATKFTNGYVDDVFFAGSGSPGVGTVTGMTPKSITMNGSGTVNLGGQGLQVHTVTVNAGAIHFEKGIYNGNRNFVVNAGVVGIGPNTVQVNSLALVSGEFRVGNRWNTFAGSAKLAGTVTYSGTTTQAKITKWNGGGTVDLNGGSRSFDIANGTSDVDLLVTLPVVSLTGTGSLVKNGLGTLELSGNNTYNGTTSINFGRLKISGTTSGQGDCTVAADATLGGGGTLGLAAGKKVAFLSGGRLEADATGTDPLHIVGDLDLSAGGAVATFVGTPTVDATVLTYSGSLTGKFSATENLPPEFGLDYATPGTIKLIEIQIGTVVMIR